MIYIAIISINILWIFRTTNTKHKLLWQGVQSTGAILVQGFRQDKVESCSSTDQRKDKD